MMTEDRQATCEERIDAHLASRLEDIGALMRAVQGADFEAVSDSDIGSVLNLAEPTIERDEDDPDTCTIDGEATDWEDFRERATERLDEYPLSVSFKRVMTVQLSWGGPSDEFEVEVDGGRIESTPVYLFKDWFDGARRSCSDDVAQDFLAYFAELDEGAS